MTSSTRGFCGSFSTPGPQRQRPLPRVAVALRTATRLLAHQQWQRIRQSLQEDGLAESDDVVEVTGGLAENFAEFNITMSVI